MNQHQLNNFRYRAWIAGIVLIALFTTCKKPFNPVIVASDVSYLVVEGTINSGSDTTFIKLSRTVKLDSGATKPEIGASVTVQGDDGSSHPLNVYSPGKYFVVGLNLPTTHKYRLSIRTADSREYQSDYVENKITPPIDSLNYQQVGQQGVQLYISSHDSKNATRYYRWDYDETWSYYSADFAQIKWENGEIKYLTIDELYSECYKFASPSNSIYLGSTAKLQSDVLYKAPLAYVYASSGKLAHIYSIFVRQYALTGDAYNYWQTLQKNTEKLGSIFDAQPSTLTGNIHGVTDPKEIVIGYVSVSTVTSMRYFVEGRNLSLYTPELSVCTEPMKEIPIIPDSTLFARLHGTLDSKDYLLVREDTNPITLQLVGYFYAPAICVDCRLQGGTNHKPSYWPY